MCDSGRLRLCVSVFILGLLAPIHLLAQTNWDPPTNKVFVLAVNTHPDDEGIFFGGVMSYYSAALKLPTQLISMTSGDWYPTNLTIREAELRCAAVKYGLRYEPAFLRFRDVSSSMPNNPYADKINATWDYWADGVLQGDGSDVEAGKQKAIVSLAEQIRRFRPEIVMTQDEQGEYGHLNHIACVWALTNAFFLAADPTATNASLVSLPPWQAKKLYLHLFPQNRLFHPYLEIPIPELSNLTCRQMADQGLDCHVSQRSPDVSTVYRTGENFDGYHSEWWGLYFSTVGPDRVLTNATTVKGYAVPAGVALGNFLDHLDVTNQPAPPAFVSDSISLPAAFTGAVYTGPAPSTLAWDPDLLWGDSLTFSILSGPAWLSVSSDGQLTGTPGLQDIGTNVFHVRVTDLSGSTDEALLLLPVTSPPSPAVNLVGWWKLDELSGSVCMDSAAPAQNGVYTSPELAIPGATPTTGTAARFNGTTAKVDVPFSAELNPPQFTVALWVNVQGGSSSYRSPLTSRESVPMAGYVFYAGQNNLWQFWTGAGSGWKVLNAGAVKINEWIHLAGTYDGSSTRFYTNGVLAGSTNAAFQPNSKYPTRIGSGGSEQATGQYWFPGSVDDVRIYNIALSAQQIAALHSNTAPVFISDPAPVSVRAGTRMNDSLASLVFDDSGSVTFSKLSGPNWLQVDTQGVLSGIPQSSNTGPNHFSFAVTDAFGAQDTAGMDVYVLPGQLPSLSLISKQSGGEALLTFSAPDGQMYVIECSPDLQPGSWVPVATNSTGTNLFEWSDPGSPEHPMRFYRTMIP